MPDFKDLQEQLFTSRQEKEVVELSFFKAKEKLNKLQRSKEALLRVIDPDDYRIQDINYREEELVIAVDRLKVSFEEIQLEETIKIKNFHSFNNPKENIENLSDEYPFLLFPVRIETRFKKIEHVVGTQDQLWVRVYPDDIAIDTFEETLSESEVKLARSYWAGIWKAGGVEEQERSAWKGFVSRWGAGRSYWITENYQPLNSIDKPVKEKKDDIILVISTDSPISNDDEREAIKKYWEVVWRDLNNQQQAWQHLVEIVSESRAEILLKEYVPVNLKSKNGSSSVSDDINIEVVFIVFPDEEEIDTRQFSWSQAPKAKLLPERLVLLGYNYDEENVELEKTLEILGNGIPSSLSIGPSPTADEEDQLRLEDDEIVVNKDMKWMTDFDEAIRVGMGFKVNLSSGQAKEGFDRLFVLGVRLSESAINSKSSLESLIDHHHKSKNGFSIIPQGSPTNNTEKESSQYRWKEDPDESFDRYFKLANDQREDPTDPLTKKDGRWLAESLGINPEILKNIPNYYGTDQCEAKAMNTALWPATLGYFMETMMSPMFDETSIEQTKSFFNKYVSGRGMIPAIRVGKQPYGILPTTTFSRMSWLTPFEGATAATIAAVETGEQRFFRKLYHLLQRIDDDFAKQLDNVSYVGKEGDAHQILLDIIGLNPTSVDFDRRMIESLLQLHNRIIEGWDDVAVSISMQLMERNAELLREFGYEIENLDQYPDILKKSFWLQPENIDRKLIDDNPLSERDSIESNRIDGKNYIEWMISAARTSHDTLRRQEGFEDDKPPFSLLYAMLRHSLDLSFVNTVFKMHEHANVFTKEEVIKYKKESPFLYINNKGESPWKFLYKTEPRITSLQDMYLSEYISNVLGQDKATKYLYEQVAALEHLKNIPTARLERIFVEHLDTCSYRLDSWFSGLVNYQLSLMRYEQQDNEEDQIKEGIYLGTYGWLEDVRSEDKKLTGVDFEQLNDQELKETFGGSDDSPITLDDKNNGYIHTPSLNHAVTAAILRNGYISNSYSNDDSENKNEDFLAINLSSERVRLALSIIEGIRAGQSIAALLGYQFERGLHDRHDVEVDSFIFELRKEFPLVGKQNSETETEESENAPIQSIEARNVINGADLIEHIKGLEVKEYPFDLNGLPDNASTGEKKAIKEEIDKILNINDAIADLAIAESVHQVVQGNYDRAAATLDTYSKGNFPPIPDLIQTPRSGITLTHRVGLHLETGLNPEDGLTPRSVAEPAINKWLTSVLPPLKDIVCRVSNRNEPVSAFDLNLTPIDLLYMVDTDSEQAMTSLDDALVYYMYQKSEMRSDAGIFIEYTEPIEGKITFFELSPLIRSLRNLLLQSRPLKAGDITLANEANKTLENDVFLDPERINKNNLLLMKLKERLSHLIDTKLTPFFDDENTIIDGQQENVINQVDDLIIEHADILNDLSWFGLPQTGIGFIFQWKQQLFITIHEKLNKLIERWDSKLVKFNHLIDDYNKTTDDDDKISLLQKAERLISTESTVPIPDTHAKYRDILQDIKKPDFNGHLIKIRSLMDINILSELFRKLSIIKNDHDKFDLIEIEIEEEQKQVFVFTEDIKSGAESFHNDLLERLKVVKAQLEIHAGPTTQAEKVKSLLEAGKQMFGEDFKIVPEFGLANKQADEWGNAWSHRASLMTYITEEAKVDFPVDDWLYGIARVRDKIHHLENSILLSDAFGTFGLKLEPIQLPYRNPDFWLAMEFPNSYRNSEDIESNFEIAEDKLLYTSVYSTPFDKEKIQCGLLLDEWTEVIPSEEETTGLTFHYDRPNSEPPQTLLLVTPSEFKGSWQWDDLVDTLHETLDQAKKRAIEPDHIGKTDYSQFLPAIISAETRYPVMPILNYAMNATIFVSLSNDV